MLVRSYLTSSINSIINEVTAGDNLNQLACNTTIRRICLRSRRARLLGCHSQWSRSKVAGLTSQVTNLEIPWCVALRWLDLVVHQVPVGSPSAWIFNRLGREWLHCGDGMPLAGHVDPSSEGSYPSRYPSFPLLWCHLDRSSASRIGTCASTGCSNCSRPWNPPSRQLF
jgi:hypothetical protein